MRVVILILNLGLLVACMPQNSSEQRPISGPGNAVIYGDDSRQDLPLSSLNSQARATALIISTSNLRATEPGAYAFRKLKLRDGYPLCENERFLDQYLLGNCTGVLVGLRHVLTAGHCFISEKDCPQIQMTFGFNFEKSKLGFLKQADLYSCQKIQFRSLAGLGPQSGLAIVELDRDVAEAAPVRLAPAALSPHEIVYNYSYPLGLPLKLDVGHIVKNDPHRPYLEVAIDTFSGSSGSGLFNRKGELIGILDNGAEDFLEEDIRRIQTSGGCLNFHRCRKGTCPTHERFLKVFDIY